MDDENLSPGAILAAQRRIVDKDGCEHCGQPFKGYKKQKYCSDKCRYRASYLRKQVLPEYATTPTLVKHPSGRGGPGEPIL